MFFHKKKEIKNKIKIFLQINKQKVHNILWNQLTRTILQHFSFNIV